MLSKWCRGRCRCNLIRLGLDNCWNRQFGRSVLHISSAAVVGHVPPSPLCQFVKIHPLRPNPLHPVLHCSGDHAHHPAGLVIYTQLALRCIFVIFLIFLIHLILGTCKIPETLSNCIRHIFKRLFRLPGGQSRHFNIAHIFLLLLNRCLCVFNSLSSHCSFSLHIILTPLLFPFIAQKVRFSIFLWCKLLCRLLATQWYKGSDPFCLQHALHFIHLMTSSCGLLCRFAICACQESGKGPFWSIDHCISCWLLLGLMLDVARYGLYGGKLRLLFQAWYTWSMWTKQILCFDHH